MKRDGRALDHRTLEGIRRMAVQRVWVGERPSVVIASYGLSRQIIYKWLREAKGKGRGLRALRSRKASGRPRRLTDKQERQLFHWINCKEPRQHGFDFGLWTRLVVRRLIAAKFEVDLGLTAVGKLLTKLGLTPRKLLKRAYERDPAAIEAWRLGTYPGISKRAKQRSAEIYFWDESDFRGVALRGTAPSTKRQAPIGAVAGKRESVSAASAVNAKGGFWFATYHGMMSAELFIEMLKVLMRGRTKPLFMILDNIPAHRAKIVHDFVASTNENLQFFFLPGYAAEPNPDELMWNCMKRMETAQRPPSKAEALHAIVARSDEILRVQPNQNDELVSEAERAVACS
jgi:transposase